MTRPTLLYLALISSLCLATGCQNDDFVPYTVPSELILEEAKVNVSDMSVSMSAWYNGDDSGIADAWFAIKAAGNDDAEGQRIDCSWKSGKASAKISGMELGTDYIYGFHIRTIGGNIISSTEEKTLEFSIPGNFTFSSMKTLTSKIVEIDYTGADDFIVSADMTIWNSEGMEMDNVPEVFWNDGKVRLMFRLDDWEEDIYTCRIDFTLYDGAIVSANGTFSMLPLPENLTMGKVITDETGKFTFSASYDGEDYTVTKVTFILYDKDGNYLDEIEGTAADRVASAVLENQTYGQYSVECILDLIDGSRLISDRLSFAYSKPRAYENMLLEPIPMSEAGLVTNGDDCKVATKFSYLGYDWESLNLYARSSSSVTLYIKSSTPGYFMNVTPFENGIKTIYINHSSSKDTNKFNCYGKTDENDSWIKMAEAVKDGNTFIYDLSGGNYRYFKFETTTQELKANSFAIDWYTEPIE